MLQTNVLEYLEASAARVPDKVAFADKENSFTFSQLQRAAQGLGTALAELTPRHNAPVCVLVERTAATLAAFQGVLYAGNFYVPIDSQMPLARMERIFETLSPAALIYPAALEGTARALSRFCPALELEAGLAHPADGEELARRRAMVLDTDPVYVIFTSGSTGTPKGIVICHRSVIDFVEWLAQAGEFSDRDVLGNQAPFYFDLSVKDIYLTLKCGATTHIIPQNLFIFPLPLAPVQCILLCLDPGKEDVAARAEELYAQLQAGGLSVLLDDREERPGVKFKDADLLGAPMQLIVGGKGLARGVVECKDRRTGEKGELPLEGFAEAFAAWAESVRQGWESSRK